MKNPFSFVGLDSVSALLFQSNLVEKGDHVPQHHHNNSLSLPAKWNHPSKTLDRDLLHDDSASVASTSSSSSSSQHTDQSSTINCKSVRFDETRNHIYYCSVADKNYARHSHDGMYHHDDENHERWYSRADLMHFKYSTNLLARTIRQQSEARGSRNNNKNTCRASRYVAPSSSTRNSTTHSLINEAATTMAFAHCCRLCSIQNQKEAELILQQEEQEDEQQHEHQINNQHPLDASSTHDPTTSISTSNNSILPPLVQSQLQQWFQQESPTTGPIRWGLVTAGSTSMMTERTQRRQALYQIIRPQERRRRQQEDRQDEDDENEHRQRYSTTPQQPSSSWWEYASSTATLFLTGYHAHHHEEDTASDETDDYSSTNQEVDDAKEELRRECLRISQPSVLFAREVALAQAAVLQREEGSCER